VAPAAPQQVYDDCRQALDRQLSCRDPEDGDDIDFELCLDSAQTMPCDIVSDAYTEEGLLTGPTSCESFLGEK
jgi:hypothetical protein